MERGPVIRRSLLVALVVAAVAAIVVAMALATRAPERAEPSPLPTLTTPVPTLAASATPTPAASPTPFPSPTVAGTFENRVLGYRIKMPDEYRHSLGRVFTGQERLGDDHFTTQTEAEARAACMEDAGHIPTPREPPDIGVQVHRNPSGLTADAWAKTPQTPGGQARSHHHSVVGFVVGPYEAVKLVQDNASAATSAVVIRANDRVYEISYTGAWSPWSPSMQTFLDDIARTFEAIQPAAHPSATPTQSPEIAARDVADALVRAFAARDADAVRRLMPECHIGFAYAVDGVVPGQGGNNRSVHLFTQGLRELFATGALTVTIDRTLRSESDAGGVRYYLRSEWREPDRTTRVDLYLQDRGGAWLWGGATHHFASGECISFRRPWSSTQGGC